MANLTPRPAPQVKQRPLTEEEKKIKIAQFLQQKRETISVNLLCNLVHGAITNNNVTNMDCKGLVNLSVEMADALLDRLYPIKEESK